MSKSIRVVIRQPLHPLLERVAKQMNIDDYGEVVNYLLLELQKQNYNFSNSGNQTQTTTPNTAPDLKDQLAGMLT